MPDVYVGPKSFSILIQHDRDRAPNIATKVTNASLIWMYFNARNVLLLALAAPALSLATGCASPGVPQPPSLHLPAPAKNLRAQRVGDHVALTWTTPDVTTDGQAVRLPITAVVCLETIAKPRSKPGQIKPTEHQAPCLPIQRQTVTPGETHALQPLPPTLLTDPPQLLAYRVELQNAKGRSAAAPAPAYAASGSYPPPAGPIRATPTRNGVAVEWPPQPSTAPMELHRALVPDPKSPPPTAKPATNNPLTPKKTPTEVSLRAPASETEDPGGLLDQTAKAPNTYTYVAQRVRTVTLGSHTLEIRGEPSPPTTLVDRDVFPPRAPTGLTSIASTFGDKPSIDLSWEPNAEPDLIGYNTYRADAPTAPFRKLNSTPSPGPAYRDFTAEPNHSYTYRVTALDQNHNEGPPSPTIQDTLTPRQ